MDFNGFGGGRVQYLQAQLFPVCTLTASNGGLLGNFLSKGLKTNQLVVNTDEKTLKPIARLREPRDLFALPKDKDNDCSQQAPRWPIECQVIGERITHIPYVPVQPEPLNVPTGNELKPRPVGEENGIVVFSYCPISAVNYVGTSSKSKAEDKSSDDSDDSSDSRNEFMPVSRRKSGKSQVHSVSKLLNRLDDHSTSNSQDDDYDDDDYDTSGGNAGACGKVDHVKSFHQSPTNAKKSRFTTTAAANPASTGSSKSTAVKGSTGVDDIWKDNSSDYKSASPYAMSQFDKKVSKAIIDKIVDYDDKQSASGANSHSSEKVAFQNSSHQSIDKERPPKKKLPCGSSKNYGDTDEDTNSSSSTSDDDDDCSSAETNDSVKVETIDSHQGSPVNRLAGGADKLPATTADSVSDTETLVGAESMSRLASTANDDKTPNTSLTLPLPSISPTRERNVAAAAAAAARGRRRGFEIHQESNNDIVGVSHTNTCGTNTSTYDPANSDKRCPTAEINNNNERANFQSQTLSYDIPQMQFSRSSVGGAKYVSNCHPMNTEDYESLEFESRFESGNLAKAVQITPTYYELYLRPDLYTSRSKQWFYFRVKNTRRNMLYRFSIVNLVKSDSLYNDGMRPVMYSTLGAKEKNEGWRRCGNNISYYRNDDESNNNTNEEDEDNSSYTLTFTIEFEYDNDTVFFAHSYPYTYSDLQDYLMEIQRHPVKSKFCKLRLLCRTLAGNNVYYLTVTAPSNNEDASRRKKSIVVSARVHPSETPSSWMMKGLMDFITGESTVAKRLRHKFIFKLVPMLNPDGVIVGNTRNSLTGKDLNRQYRTVIRETYPSIWYTKAMIRRLIEECGVAMYCDMHAHSRKHNIFIYGCENKRNPEKRLTEQVFPLMLHKNSADRFSFESCKFKIQRSKEGTGRIVVWMLGITNSYTIEASFGGSSLGSRKGTHFNIQDYEHMGRAFCETLLDYCDENPNKERLRSKIIERLMREGSSADEPLNIPLSDYSSDEGNCSSSSDNEGKHSITASDLEGPCCAPIRAPPSSPEIMHEIRKFRVRRMHKVMHVLDQIYFSPVLQRKFKALARLKRRRHKLGCKVVTTIKRSTGGGGGGGGGGGSGSGGGSVVGPSSPGGNNNESRKQQRPQITIKMSQQSADSESSDTNGSQSSELLTDGSNGVEATPQTSKQPARKRAKKKKHMPIEKAKVKTLSHKMRIDRNLRLWLANRRIFIFRRKKNRRQRLRNKPLKKRGEVVRTPLDLPTTDPGSDLHFSTDDEEIFPTTNTTFGAVALRHTLLQSDLQRRYIEEIGDLVVQKPKHNMPPELIVTTPSKSTGSGGIKKLELYKLTPSTAPEQHHEGGGGGGAGGLQVVHGQASGTSTLRTYSWHNLNQDSQSGRAKAALFVHNEPKVPTAAVKMQKTPPRRVPNNFNPFSQQRQGHQAAAANQDDVKLSLKKKIWTGVHGDSDNRPLFYCKGQTQAPPPMENAMAAAAGAALFRTTAGGGGGGGVGAHGRNVFSSAIKEPVATTTGSATAIATMPPAYVGAPRRSRKIEQVDLFNACSQKLLIWQQEHKKVQSSNTRLMGGTSAKVDNSQILMRGSKTKKAIRTVGGNDMNVAGVAGKTKRKSSMIKIAETTQLVTRFSRMHNSAGHSANVPAAGASVHQHPQMTQTQRLILKTQPNGSAADSINHNASVSGVQSRGGRTATKFKTGGIVVTAVQQSAVSHGGSSGVSRRLRHHGGGLLVRNGTNNAAGGSGAQNMLQYRTTSSLPEEKSVGGITLDTVNLVRKVKTKLKKRKSRTLANAAATVTK